MRRLVNVRRFFTAFNLLDRFNGERCKKDPATGERKKSDCLSLSFGKGGLRKELVLEMSQKEFIFEKAFDKMAVWWEGEGQGR